MAKLIDLIPYRLRSEPVADFENAIQPSLDALESAFWAMTENIVVDTAEDWLPLWEWAYGLTGSGSVEARRSAVKAKMRGAGTTTLDRIQAVADAYANAGATVWEDNPAYMFYIRLNLTGDAVPDIPGLKRVLEENHLLDGFTQDLANQSRLIFQMLRLTRQAELTQELNDKAFPREEGFDLAMVCQGMADEATWLADLAGVRFTYSSNVDHLPFQGSKSLLTQMLLALVSNGVRAAGKEGAVEMKLHAEHGRCVISVRDTGVGISEERLATLFSVDAPEEVPRPGEGAGLGLYNAQRIVALHGGVLVAQSSQEGGACLVASLPIVTPTSVPARNNPGYDNLGGYSPVLIEMSDVLPWQAFVPGKSEE